MQAEGSKARIFTKRAERHKKMLHFLESNATLCAGHPVKAALPYAGIFLTTVYLFVKKCIMRLHCGGMYD